MCDGEGGRRRKARVCVMGRRKAQVCDRGRRGGGRLRCV